jgi:hypothetical protein
MEWLKSVWARWKVQVSVIGGVLVVATAYGTCSCEPPAAAVSEFTPATEITETATTAVEVSATTNSKDANSFEEATTTTTE